jgi:hypothetical protein
MRAAVVLALATGCSFVRTSNPPPPCNTSSVAPIVDTAVAVVSAIGIVYFATTDDDNATLGVVVTSGLALGFGASAYTGFPRVSRCRDATAAARK